MHKILPMLLIALLSLSACKSGNTTSKTIPSNDPVQTKLQELAGGAAKDCGVVTSQAAADLDQASKCAMDAARAKSPFYVEYQMPGMNVALAGNTQGKLYSVQSQAGGAGLTTTDCPAELRVAQSGRVSCYAPGTFPMGGGSHAAMPDMGMGSGPMPPGHPNVKKPATPAKP